MGHQQQPKRFKKRSTKPKKGARKCPTGKVRFRDALEADMALARAQRPDAPSRRRECRKYLCEKCKGFHLTSQPKR